MRFVHLNLHTEFSISDGLIRIKPLFGQLKEQHVECVALTDMGNAFAAIKFYETALKNGIKPIIGAECHLKNGHEYLGRMTLLAQNYKGYLNLSKLLSEGYRHGQERGVPHITYEWLNEFNEGLILIAGKESPIGTTLLTLKEENWGKSLAPFAAFKDRLYLGLSRTEQDNDEAFILAAKRLAISHQLPLVAVNNVRFLHKSDFDAHEIRTCIQAGNVISDNKRPRLYSPEQYLKSPEEMIALFSDIPEAIENTVEIAKRCTVELSLGKPCLPNFPVPEGMTMDDYFRHLSYEGLKYRIGENHPQQKAYEERLKIELDVIINMGFPGYFLIVADFIQWSKDHDIPVGPGRGSGAGSLVAWALKITDLDPLPYDLLFERFLNPERVSMPDFDVDFCMEGRDRVIEYVAEKYGRDAVSQIATHGTMAAKAVIRDVGRALGHPYGFVDRIAKLIPFDLGITLDKALMQEPELHDLYEKDEEVKELIDYAKQLEGLTKSVGRHAGGVVISPTTITDFSPLYCEEGSEALVAQYDKSDVESAGLVKFDFLGLRTLTIINWAIQNIQKTHGLEINILDIPLDDKAAFDLLKSCKTTAVFQLESRGMKDLIRRLQPDTFEDIIALVALFRPGPLESGMVEDFINRKHGRAEIEYPFPELETVLAPTYGVIVYQEQVMQISQVIGNYTLGGADLLRRAMGKKLPEEMEKQRGLFMQGAEELGFDKEKAGALFDLMEKFAGYGFNKSHSAAYALVSYQTAYLKAHYPAEFMAAVLSSDMDNTEKVVTFIEECEDMGLKILPPDVNRSHYKFTVSDKGEIIYGLGAIKGVGEAAALQAIDERQNNGRFVDLFDFCRRIDLSKMNRRVVETLIKAGALDGLDPAVQSVEARCQFRADLLETLPDAIHSAEQHHRNQNSGQEDLFGLFGDDAGSTVTITTPLKHGDAWSERMLLEHESATLGFYLTTHPINRYRHEIKAITSHSIGEVLNMTQPGYRIARAAEPECTIAGIVIQMRTKINQKGQKMTFVTLDDRTGRMELRLYDEHLENLNEPLSTKSILVVKGSLMWDEFNNGMRTRPLSIETIESTRNTMARALILHNKTSIDVARIEQLIETVANFRATEGKPIYLKFQNHDANILIKLGPSWTVRLSDDLLENVTRAFHDVSVKVKY
ncbi:DNA polymerase III subunit alpha [Wohlfahrtiimonas chitiniclastica]|uniref:DNA polymerase III subunit alpha n=1 Tax=Wohlfahrtiimonas chitiniclastica TaxID=400946 RepID=UPI001BCB48ED|nr:DNA polymerase III subunit alpha [Wohlfahrtiimonas chitiniclastica]MBS7836353.1 DNA polymerase III subunit alpha [Wohlfahrtiimonas chitiniclastica]